MGVIKAVTVVYLTNSNAAGFELCILNFVL